MMEMKKIRAITDAIQTERAAEAALSHRVFRNCY